MYKNYFSAFVPQIKCVVKLYFRRDLVSGSFIGSWGWGGVGGGGAVSLMGGFT